MVNTAVESVKWDKRVNGSSLRGYINASYSDLVEAFGEPKSDTDEYKTDVEWILVFNDDVVATIYNYKDGKNYCGANGLNVEDIREWHVGGKGFNTVMALDDFFVDNNFRISVQMK